MNLDLQRYSHVRATLVIFQCSATARPADTCKAFTPSRSPTTIVSLAVAVALISPHDTIASTA